MDIGTSEYLITMAIGLPHCVEVVVGSVSAIFVFSVFGIGLHLSLYLAKQSLRLISDQHKEYAIFYSLDFIFDLGRVSIP